MMLDKITEELASRSHDIMARPNLQLLHIFVCPNPIIYCVHNLVFSCRLDLFFPKTSYIPEFATFTGDRLNHHLT
jgi:hypothetical protein